MPSRLRPNNKYCPNKQSPAVDGFGQRAQSVTLIVIRAISSGQSPPPDTVYSADIIAQAKPLPSKLVPDKAGAPPTALNTPPDTPTKVDKSTALVPSVLSLHTLAVASPPAIGAASTVTVTASL
ncbi:MAG: hypothetical protein IPL33_21010 [Sphingobacteriales bacterium]|nr:hypothetical protein [Sphingobacteriales bacterium]